MSSKNHLLGLSIHYRNKEIMFDDFGNVVMLFFNESPSDIKVLTSKFTKSKLGIKNTATRIDSKFLSKDFIEDTFEEMSSNSFNVIDFIQFGQTRKRDWDYLDYKEYLEIAPKPKYKKKFLKPRRL